MSISKRLVALLASCIILFSGCEHETIITEQKSRVEITFSWWGNDTRTEYTIEGVRKFEELNPGIKVNVSYSEWSGYELRNRIQMISGREADVMQINFGWLSEFSPDGKGYYDIAQLDEYFDLTTYDQDILDYGKRGGILNAVPIAMNTETVYINRTIYDKYGLNIPETWDDYVNAAKVMKKDDVYPIAGPSKSLWLFSVAYAEQMTGKKLLTDNGKLNFKAPELKIMLDFYDRMVDEKVFPPVEYYDRLSIDNGTYAGTVAWVSDAQNYYKKALENGNEIVITSYPHDASHESGEGWYAKPATLYAVSRNTEHPKEAAMLLEFLMNSVEMAELQGVEKGVPLSKRARIALLANNKLEGLQYEASSKMETTKTIEKMNPFIEDGGLIDKFIDACDLVIFDKASSEEAAEQLYKEILDMK